MSYYLGIDTSNYTTSSAIYNPKEDIIIQSKKLLPVKDGEIGLRQSDAVFHHTQQLPQIIDNIFNNKVIQLNAVGASVKPRNKEGSYMPCFTVGSSVAEIISSILDVPFYSFSHQSGHIAAALYSANKLELIDKKFIAFHISGGTTEALMVTPNSEDIFDVEIIAKTLDANAGQIIDRVGVLLGLSFPAGAELEKLAINYINDYGQIKVRPSMKGSNCCLSGIENICKKLVTDGESKEKTAAVCFSYIQSSLREMCMSLIKEYGELPLLFSGGVMSSTIIKNDFTKRFNAYFAQPQFSSDNSCGVAVLTALKAEGL